MVETDSPYLGGAADRRNEPATTLRVAAELAKLRGTTAETIAAAVARNFASVLA